MFIILTVGMPKGVILTHGAIVSDVSAIHKHNVSCEYEHTHTTHTHTHTHTRIHI